MSIGLYIHVPFCARKCAYCDFASYAGSEGALPGYLDALEREMGRCPSHEVETVYVGGGTPSLLSGDQMARLMDAVRARFDLLPGAEISMEANPGTLDMPKLEAYRAAGVNRLSIGVQAVQDHLLEALGRIHRFPDAVEAVEMARAAGFTNINIDLMYALPGQTMADWQDALTSVIALRPEHVSAYSLILEEGTTLAARNDLTYPDEDEVIAMQRLATRMLAEAGLHRYEISNYAKPGYECRHNIVYWTRGEYLGLGAAAHSMLGGARFANSSGIAYVPLDSASLSAEDVEDERVMLGTRMLCGIEIGALALDRIEKLRGLGLLEHDGHRLWLTEKGLELHSAVVLELLSH